MRIRWLVALGFISSACWSLTADRDGVFGDGRPVSPEAGTEASMDAEASTGHRPDHRFCGTLDASPTLCIEFEDDGGIGPSSFETEQGATASLEPRGAGRALLLTGPAGTDSPNAVFRYDTPGLPAEGRIQFDLAIDAVAEGGAAVPIASFVFRGQGKYHKVEIWLYNGQKIKLSQNGSFGLNSSAEATIRPAIGEWHRYELRAQFTGSSVAIVSMDGQTIAELPIAPLPDVEPTTSLELGMTVGPPYPTEGSTILHMDNIVYDLILL